MADDTYESISDEILEKAQNELKDYLDKNNIPKSMKIMLETQSYILMILSSDHRKVGKMFPAFKRDQIQGDDNKRLKYTFYSMAISTAFMLLVNGVLWFFKILPVLNKMQP